jgi:ribosomal protein S18 acetylase RimI-like enzyme
MPLEIIIADASHAEAISTIGKKSFRVAFEHLFNKKEDLQEYLDYTFNYRKIIASIRKENNIYFMASLDGAPIGFAKVKKHSLNQQINYYAQMELQKIYVLFEHNGSGARFALIHSAIQLAQEMQPDYLWLDVPVSNTKAISFYERNGFKKHDKYYFIIGTQPFQYYLLALPVAVSNLVKL